MKKTIATILTLGIILTSCTKKNSIEPIKEEQTSTVDIQDTTTNLYSFSFQNLNGYGSTLNDNVTIKINGIEKNGLINVSPWIGSSFDMEGPTYIRLRLKKNDVMEYKCNYIVTVDSMMEAITYSNIFIRKNGVLIHTLYKNDNGKFLPSPIVMSYTVQ